ncbi:MAG: GNAT family N-acetyltransferase [Myxococcota bacterium]
MQDLPCLRTPRCIVRLSARDDAPKLLEYWSANGQRYDPPLPSPMLEEQLWAEASDRARAEFRAGSSCKLYGFSADGQSVVGTVALTSMHSDAEGHCRLGYGIAGACEGQGMMHEIVSAVIVYAFDDLGLRRIEADCAPDNRRSARLLERLGFASTDPRAAVPIRFHLVPEMRSSGA